MRLHRQRPRVPAAERKSRHQDPWCRLSCYFFFSAFFAGFFFPPPP
jgi:hypothetical protein